MGEFSTKTDAQLLEAYRAGNGEALDRLIERYKTTVEAIAMK